MRLSFAALVFPLLLAGCATVPRQDHPAVATMQQQAIDRLVERYLEWRGGTAFQQLATTYTVADVEMAGLNGVTREWRTRPGATRDELELGPLTQQTVYDGNHGWTRNESLVTPKSKHDVLDAIRAAQVEFGIALRGGPGVSRELRTEELDGRRWSVLSIGFGDNDRYELFLDPNTGALHGRRYITDARPRFVRYSDWRVVQGVRVSFFREAYRSNGKLNATVRLRSATLDEAFEPALFAKPAQERTISFAGNARSTGPMKYNPHTGTRIYIKSTVNGHPVELLLDSGADGTILDKGLAERIGLVPVGKTVASGDGGEQESAFAQNVSIKMANLSLRLKRVAVTDLAEVAARIATPLPIVLGADIFLQTIVEIDPAAHTIAFHEPNGFQPPDGATMVPLEPLGSLRGVPVSVEGLPDGQMVFDLGNGGLMSLTPAFWQRHRLLEGRRSGTRKAGAVGGDHIHRVATLRTIRFAGYTFHDVPAEFSTPNIEIDSDREAGNVGMPLLGRFRMWIDYQNNRLFVKPLPQRIADPFKRSRVGFRSDRVGNRLEVRHIDEGSPAQTAGLKVGDAIVAINGEKITPGFSTGPHSDWATRAVGTTFILTLADGTKRKLTLADYY